MGSLLWRAALRDVPYAVLGPAGWERDEALPLIVLLHGADSSREALAMFQPLLESMWDDGSLPRSVVACASTPTAGGFYIGRWERFVAEEFVAHLVDEYDVADARVSLVGSSMGGYGALKMAMAAPERWQAVAAVAPAVLPDNAGPRNTFGLLGQLREAMGEGDSVLHRLRANANAVRASGLPIFLRAGDRDMFRMHDGTEQLHRALWDADIGHEYHLVHEADHVGPEGLAAQRAAFAFVGAAQRRAAGTDRSDADRASEAEWRAWAESRQGPPPALDPFGVTAPLALRLMLSLPSNDNERRYGQLE